jgi:hypothetical protein
MIAVLEKMEKRGSSVPESVIHAGWSCLCEGATYFSQRRPAPYQTKGQYDWIESHNVGKVGLIVNEKDTAEEVICKIFAAVAAGNALDIYVNDGVGGVMAEVAEMLGGKPENLFQEVHMITNFEYLGQDLLLNLDRKKDDAGRLACLMYANAKNVDPRVNEMVSKIAAAHSVYIDRRPAIGDGLVDMVTQFRQQSYCWVYHVAGDTGYEDMIVENNPEQAPYKRDV